ncbi:uncharacterized protein [Triticum aestivum]|uniref:uncharacterized protein isoform X1 n=1 Tax=Triticum aestivum TaxID=4565 RepID=UPI001D02A3E1|nr:uncharacterized protein LOC123043901 isoform X1 [Triticum aestivum]XP_044322425.1 uncharacterized protein LOC123043901 isoform X1 [Triticum aestivum]XP_044322426.1 uncharacterized protein LOC123043901 isoform X1 [Triticum aestivum]XP_044322427.1 uncharacterized protein LOC123043901 isoform X1 [Triticum aestivum]XP_044322428.1 uncharacterized protein LOC123043901 isoform X1 [Triticum aestivum]
MLDCPEGGMDSTFRIDFLLNSEIASVVQVRETCRKMCRTKKLIMHQYNLHHQWIYSSNFCEGLCCCLPMSRSAFARRYLSFLFYLIQYASILIDDRSAICMKWMHRDLKPENFLFANWKETAALKAIDFGLFVLFFTPSRVNPNILYGYR